RAPARAEAQCRARAQLRYRSPPDGARATGTGAGRPRSGAHASSGLRDGRRPLRRVGDVRVRRAGRPRPERPLPRRRGAGGGSGAMTEERTYETAVARLEEIIRRLDSGEAELREALEVIRRG